MPRRYCFRLHFFNLTSFAPHPLANEHVLTWPYTVSDSRAAPYISVMDGLVSLHAKWVADGECYSDVVTVC